MSVPEPRTGPRRLPFTLAFLGVMLVANALAGTLSGRIDPGVLAARGIGVDALRDGDLTRLASAVFLSHDLPMLLRQVVFAAAVIGRAEWLWGSRRTAALFFATDLATTGILLAAVRTLPALHPLSGTVDVGMSMGGFGLAGALVATSRRPRVGAAAVLALVAAKYALAPDPFADGGHVVAFVLGLGVGAVAGRARGVEMAPAPVRQAPQTGRARGRRDDRVMRQDGQP